MNVLIAGGGRTGARLANLLLNQNYKVRLVENRRELLGHLHQELPTEVIYEGNPVDPSILEAAGIRDVHAVAAVTSDDSTNLALCFLSKTMFDVPRTISRVNNPNNAWLFNEKFHVDVSLNSADVFAHLIEEEMSTPEDRRLEAVKLALSLGNDINAVNDVGETALMFAALKGRLDLSQRLIDRGARISQLGWSPLHYAATGPEPKIVALLLQHGAPIEARSPNGTTALMMAARYGSEDSVTLLLAQHADVTLRNERGMNAADFARSAGREALAKRLDSRLP